MSDKTIKPQPVVTLRIEQGTPTPAQREQCRKFWQKLIAEARSEAKND